MNLYKIFLKRSAEKELKKLPTNVHEKIIARFESLAQNPRPLNCKKLHGSSDSYRVRVGEYRILYTINDKTTAIEILSVGHRKDIYR